MITSRSLQALRGTASVKITDTNKLNSFKNPSNYSEDGIFGVINLPNILKIIHLLGQKGFPLHLKNSVSDSGWVNLKDGQYQKHYSSLVYRRNCSYNLLYVNNVPHLWFKYSNHNLSHLTTCIATACSFHWLSCHYFERPWLTETHEIPTSKYIDIFPFLPAPVAPRSKAWVCGCSLPGFVFSNPAADMDICLAGVSYVVRYRSLRQTDYSSRGVLPSMVRLKVIVKSR
jgi:hypothetical protein